MKANRRLHRHRRAYPALWSAVLAGLMDARASHPDTIKIADRAVESIVKRVVGNVLGIAPSVPAFGARSAEGPNPLAPALGLRGMQEPAATPGGAATPPGEPVSSGART